MKASVFSQAGWAFIGGTLVLLIGALVRFVPEPVTAKTPVIAQPVAPSSEASDDLGDAGNDQPLLANFPANLAQIVKLTRAGLKQDVILAYVQTSGEKYAPTADEIVYMHQAGVPEVVMEALVTQKPKAETTPAVEMATAIPREAETDSGVVKQVAAVTPTAGAVAIPQTPAPPLRPPTGSTAANFYDDLAPYGNWLQTPDSTWAWQPTVEQAVPNWQPYRDGGEWELTDNGWYWNSSYPWGWAAFHYGGWSNDPSLGWLWQPGKSWGPAWVVWRKTPTHFGWAPLPPGVSFNAEFAVQPNNLANYGFSPSTYTFVPAASFLSHNLVKHAASANQVAMLLTSSVVVGGKNRNFGIAPEEVAEATGRPVQRFSLNDATAPRPQRLNSQVVNHSLTANLGR